MFISFYRKEVKHQRGGAWQVVQQPHHFITGYSAVHFGVKGDRFVNNGFIGRLVHKFYLPSAKINTGIHNDLPDPGSELTLSPELPEMFKHLQHRFIIYGAGIVFIVAVPGTKFDHDRVTNPVQMLLAGSILLKASFNNIV